MPLQAEVCDTSLKGDEAAFAVATTEKRARRYVLIFILLIIMLAGSRELALRAIRLGCWGGGYEQDAWMAYCDSRYYGGYEHAAIWFGLEPEVAQRVQHADVLTLSSSRLQEAISVSGAFNWFSQHGISLYMLGLGYDEQSGFAEMLMRKFHPHPRLVIINADPYLTGLLSDQAKLLRDNSEHELKAALELKRFQIFHRQLCATHPWICRLTRSGFRSRVDGHWIYPPDDGLYEVFRWILREDASSGGPVIPAPPTPLNSLAKFAVQAKNLINLIDVPRQCIVFTTVPNSDQSPDISKYLAQATGGRSITPNVQNLYTRDGSHLNAESAQRWSAAFLAELQPIVQECVDHKG